MTEEPDRRRRGPVVHVEPIGAERLTPVDDEEQDALENQLPGAHRRDLTRLRLACRAGATGNVTVRKNGVRRVQVLDVNGTVLAEHHQED